MCGEAAGVEGAVSGPRWPLGAPYVTVHSQREACGGTRERTEAQPALEWDSRGTCLWRLAPLSRPATRDLPRCQGHDKGQMGTRTQLPKTSVTANTAGSLPNGRTERKASQGGGEGIGQQ